MRLTELAALDEQKAKRAEARGRLILDEAKTRIAATPIDGARATATSRLLSGDIVEAVAEMEEDTRLLVIGKRGEAADFAKLPLVSNLERVARPSPRPTLVASRAFTPLARLPDGKRTRLTSTHNRPS